MWFQLSILAFLYFHFGKPGVKQTTVDLSRAVHTLLFFLCFIFWRQFYVLWLQSLFHEPSPFIHSTSNCYSVAQSSLTLCDPMDYGTPGFPVHHLPEFAQTHVSEAIQPSHPLSSPSPPASVFPSIRGFSSQLVTSDGQSTGASITSSYWDIYIHTCIHTHKYTYHKLCQ